MKRKVVKGLVSALLVSSMVMGTPALLMAKEVETEAASEVDKKTGENFTITAEAGEIEVVNQSLLNFEKAEATEKELLLTDENKEEHSFAAEGIKNWKNLILTEQSGFLYLTYQDQDGKEQEAAEEGKEEKLDKPVTMYVSSNVHVRKSADKQAESLKISALGDEWKVTAAAPGWFKVEGDNLTGYIFHAYLTEDKASVNKLLEEKKAAEAAQAQAAQAAAEAEAAAQAAEESAAAVQEEQTYDTGDYETSVEPEEVYETGRQAYDDCDGSGHGYYEITYSDGTVGYEEY